MEALRFLEADISERPAPGWYGATIDAASWRRSQRNNRMVHVSLVLDEVSPPFDRVSDYFVLEGATARGIAYSRRRLVELFRACGLSPQAGEEIRPGDLVDAEVAVQIAHEVWQGKTRLRVVGYQPPQAVPGPEREDVDAQPCDALEELERFRE